MRSDFDISCYCPLRSRELLSLLHLKYSLNWHKKHFDQNSRGGEPEMAMHEASSCRVERGLKCDHLSMLQLKWKWEAEETTTYGKNERKLFDYMTDYYVCCIYNEYFKFSGWFRDTVTSNSLYCTEGSLCWNVS